MSVLRVSLAVLKTLVAFLQGYLQVISAGLKKGEKRLQFKCPFNQEVWRGKEGKKRMTSSAIQRTSRVKRQFYLLNRCLPTIYPNKLKILFGPIASCMETITFLFHDRFKTCGWRDF